MKTETQLDLHRLCAQQGSDGVWRVGVSAEMELLRVPVSCVSVAFDPLPITVKMFGMPVLVDRSLPPGRIELRDRDGRVLGAIDNVGTDTP